MHTQVSASSPLSDSNNRRRVNSKHDHVYSAVSKWNDDHDFNLRDETVSTFFADVKVIEQNIAAYFILSLRISADVHWKANPRNGTERKQIIIGARLSIGITGQEICLAGSFLILMIVLPAHKILENSCIVEIQTVS